jgi:hypothetical protein
VNVPLAADLYGGHWKKPSKSSAALAMSPLLYSKAAAIMMNGLVRLLRLMADPETHVLHQQALPFVGACLKAAHFSSTVRRLVQIIARRDSLPAGSDALMLQLPSLAITTLHSMCRHPSVVATLRQHPRVSGVLAHQCGPPRAEAASEDHFAAAGEEQPEQEEEPEEAEEELFQLRALLTHCVGELPPPSTRPPLAVNKNECDFCAATCHRMRHCSCDRVRYCDWICQKADWRQHKKICSARKVKKEKKAAERAAAPQGAAENRSLQKMHAARCTVPTDPHTGLPLEKNAQGAYKVGHLAGPDGRVNLWEIPGGSGRDYRFDTAMNILVPTEAMMRVVEAQRHRNPNFDPLAEIQRLGMEGFAERYM